MKYLFVICLTISFHCYAQLPAQVHPLPTKQQLAWQGMEFYLFAHFGPNTFTDKEWGEGNEQENVFDPTTLDCGQWCRVAKAAGATGIIITAKHHDGFCLWPSKYSTHTVRESKWRNGKGDVLKELSQACKQYGLKFGVYISPWDRNHPKYGTPAYNDVFVNMMKEIFANYGPIWELWWDGANGEGPNGKKQVYDWKRFQKTIREISPNTVIFSDIGPDIRWCGNENGEAGITNWNYLDTAGFTRGHGAPSVDSLNQGNVNGNSWIPAECDVSIRPGWFYHKEQDEKVKSPEALFTLYEKSVGRGANLLLNVPPDRTGLISAADSAALVGFRQLREQSFREQLAFKYSIAASGHPTVEHLVKNPLHIEVANATTAEISVELKKNSSINCIVLKEGIATGQSIQQFTITLYNKNNAVRKIAGTTIGSKKIITFPAEEISRFTLTINQSKALAVVTGIGAYRIHENLIEK